MAIEIVSFSHKTWWIFPVGYVNIYQRVDPGIAQKIMAQQVAIDGKHDGKRTGFGGTL